MNGRLLLLSCSRQKRSGRADLAALDRYDSPAFRVLRRYLRSGPPDAPMIRVLSAKYGLISADTVIDDYDVVMTRARAGELRPIVLPILEAEIEATRPSKVFVHLPAVYRLALAGFEKSLPESSTLEDATGPPGRKLAALYRWLQGPTVD